MKDFVIYYRKKKKKQPANLEKLYSVAPFTIALMGIQNYLEECG